MMIGVFNVHDMEVGPLIMVEARDLVWILFASMFWASLAILLLGIVESKGIVQLLRIPIPASGSRHHNFFDDRCLCTARQYL